MSEQNDSHVLKLLKNVQSEPKLNSHLFKQIFIVIFYLHYAIFIFSFIFLRRGERELALSPDKGAIKVAPSQWVAKQLKSGGFTPLFANAFLRSASPCFRSYLIQGILINEASNKGNIKYSRLGERKIKRASKCEGFTDNISQTLQEVYRIEPGRFCLDTQTWILLSRSKERKRT